MSKPSAATLRIFTFKEGLLSKVAHDLRLSTADATVSIDGARVEVVVRLRSLRVDGAMRRGQLVAKTLSDKDKRDILDNMHKDVLRSGTYPEARFVGEGDGVDGARFGVSGELELGGRKAPLRAVVERSGEGLHAKAALVPSRWGIKPFSAMFGTLKVQDRVEVELELPAP